MRLLAHLAPAGEVRVAARLARAALVCVALVATLLSARAAQALELSSAGSPAIVVSEDGVRVCLLLPKPREGACEGLPEDIADKVAASDAVRAFAMVRFPDQGAIPVTLTELDRGTYTAEGAPAKRLVTDYASGFRGKLVGEPEIERRGEADGPYGVYLRVRLTTRDGDGDRSFVTYFFFGERTVYAFIFSDADADHVEAFAERTMRSLEVKRFVPRRARPFEVVGAMIAVGFVVAVVVALAIFFATRRKPAAPPGFAAYGAPWQPPPGPQGPYGHPGPQGSYGQQPYGQPPRDPPYGQPPHGPGRPPHGHG